MAEKVLPGAALPGAGLLRAALLWAALLASGGAAAQEAHEAARTEAGAVGAAGLATAGGLATDAAKALDVPGFERANVPQATYTASDLESSARAALADEEDDGGRVRAFVAASAELRPKAQIRASDPGIRRGEAVQSTPNAPGWRADGLASGSVRQCARELAEAQLAGRCGGAGWCVGAHCERADTPANTGFVRAATQLNMVMEMGTEEFDRARMRIFSGERQACPIRFLGGQNCCTDSGVFVEAGLLGCEAHEIELAEARSEGLTHYLGEYCAKRFLGICRRRDRAWCVFTSQLGRILHEQARPQIGRDWDDCDGFTVAEVQRIDFDRLNLSEFTDTLLDPNEAPGVSLPDSSGTGAAMRERIRRYYKTDD